jgi:hypothetical protein
MTDLIVRPVSDEAAELEELLVARFEEEDEDAAEADGEEDWDEDGDWDDDDDWDDEDDDWDDEDEEWGRGRGVGGGDDA